MPFGVKQILKATPDRVKSIRNTLIYFFAGCLAFANLFVPKLKITGEDYAMWIGFIILSVNSFASFFGVSPDNMNSPEKQAVDTITDSNG